MQIKSIFREKKEPTEHTENTEKWTRKKDRLGVKPKPKKLYPSQEGISLLFKGIPLSKQGFPLPRFFLGFETAAEGKTIHIPEEYAEFDSKNGKVILMMNSQNNSQTRRKPGTAKGKIFMSDDFEQPLDEEIIIRYSYFLYFKYYHGPFVWNIRFT